MNTVEIAFLLENHKKALSSVLASSSPTSFSSASTRKKNSSGLKKTLDACLFLYSTFACPKDGQNGSSSRIE